MSQYKLIFTNIGLTKKQNAELNNNYIQITKFAVGSGVITNLNPNMTGLLIEEYRADINNVDTKNGTTIFDLIIPSEIGGFWIKEVALFDIDGDCICIGTVPITYKVNQDEGSSKAVHIKVSTTSTNTENIVFNTDDSLVYATVSYVNSKLEEKENVIQDGGLNIKKLDIDGATDIGVNLVDTDLIIVNDGENGTNRKSAVSRIWTYILGKLTGAISSVTTSNLTTSRALVSDANGKIAVSAVTSAELSVIDADTAPSTTTLTDSMGVVVSTPAMKQTLMSNFWTYISGKLTGAISSVATSNLTTSRALVSDTNGKIGASEITKIELEYLSDVKSNIQAQIDNRLSASTGSAVQTSPNNLLKGVGLFLHTDCPTNTDYWYIIAINYTAKQNASSMQIAISYSSPIPKMYIRTKHYSKTIWESWTQIDNSNSASLNHHHNDTYLGISNTAVDSSKLGGIHPNYYLGLNQGTNSQDPNTTLFENIVTNHINTPDSMEYWYITTKFYGSINNSSSQMQMAVQYANGNKIFVRNKYANAAWNSWREIGKQIKRLAYDGSNIDGQYGFSSVVKISAGHYRCYFTTPMPNINYSVVVGVSPNDFVVGYSNKTTTYVDINRIHSSDNIYYDGGFSIGILED